MGQLKKPPRSLELGSRYYLNALNFHAFLNMPTPDYAIKNYFTSDLASLLTKPLAIDDRTIQSRLVLAPMSLLGNIAFRELLAEFGGYGLLFSEMLDAKRLRHEHPRFSTYFTWRAHERHHLVCQILGNDPLVMAEAAKRIEAEGIWSVDINLGCAASSICKLNYGAVLLKKPSAAYRVVEAVRKAVHIPVWVKFRIGWQDNIKAAVEFAQNFESIGVNALVFHPRIAPDRRARPPKWEYIKAIKDSVRIPVFGNGNVFSEADCISMLGTTGCDGVALGRIAIARPWIMAQWTTGLAPSPCIYRRTALRYIELLARHFDEMEAIRRYKRFGQYFAANFKFGHPFLMKLINADSLKAVQRIVEDHFYTTPQLSTQPNMNHFS